MRVLESSVLGCVILGSLWSLPGAAFSQIVADHRAVGRFDAIPADALQAASRLRLMFRHASVGGTIDDGLDCLQGTREHPSECLVYPEYRYDRRSWDFQPRGNSGWYGKLDDFTSEVENQIDLFDVFAFKYCYLDALDGLQEPCGSPLDPAKVTRAWGALREGMETLEAAHPDKVFVWWTIPLTQVGQDCTERLNREIRSYVLENQKILFDIADIESQDLSGAHQTNEQGWEIAVRELCGEQKPDAQACHPNWTGKVLLAKAFWWMMARVSGWEDQTEEPLFLRGDASAEGGVDVSDAILLLSYLFAGGPAPSCRKSGDANDDGEVDIADAVTILVSLFAGGGVLPEPSAACGTDPTADGLGCVSFAPCQ